MTTFPLEPNAVYSGDARALLPQIAPASVQLSLWSPPYYVGKNYEQYLTSFEEWISLLQSVVAEHARLLKPGGFLVVNIADILAFRDTSLPRIQALNPGRQRVTVTKEEVLALKAQHPELSRSALAQRFGVSEQTIDRRLNGNNIRGGKTMTQTRVQLVGHFLEVAAQAAGLPLYDRRVWVKDPAWQNSRWAAVSYRSVSEFEDIYIFWKPGELTVNRARLTPAEWKNWGSRAVWHIRSVTRNDDHEAKFPLEVPRRVIRLLTDPGDLVLDCFLGSGTTALAAIEQRRDFLGIDLDPQAVRLARRKIAGVQMPLLAGAVAY